MTYFLNELSEEQAELAANEGAVLGVDAILAPAGSAIEADGSNTLTNSGTIAPQGFVTAVSLDGSQNWVLNEGVISSELTALSFSPRFDPGDDTQNRLVNTGTITSFFGNAVFAAGAGLTVSNSGEIFGSSSGILMFTAPGGGPIAPVANDITNHGRIVAEGGIAVNIGVGNTVLVNGGEIVGSVVLATPASQSDPASGSDDRVENSGMIFGEVRLGDRPDIYQGTGQGVVSDGVNGGAGSDTLTGSDAADLFDGGAQNDMLSGHGGADSLLGGSGRDTLTGGAGEDRLEGQDGADLLQGGEGSDRLFGNAARDALHGGSGDDRLKGGLAGDELRGGAGDDWLNGGRGNDWLRAGRGNDTLEGGTWSDTLEGGEGNDLLTGGRGRDTFVMQPGWGYDQVQDFAPGRDVIDLQSFGFSDYSNFTGEVARRALPEGVDLRFSTGDTLTVSGLTEATLSADSFIF